MKKMLYNFYKSSWVKLFYCTRCCWGDCVALFFVFMITFLFSSLAGHKAISNGYNAGGNWYAERAISVALSIYNTGEVRFAFAEPNSKLGNFLKKGSVGNVNYSSITNKEAVSAKYGNYGSYWDSTGIAWMIALWWKIIGYPDCSLLYILFSLFYSLTAVAAYYALRQVTGVIPSVFFDLVLMALPMNMWLVAFSIRDGARAFFCFIAIAVLLYQLKGICNWRGTIISSVALLFICTLSKYFRNDFIILIPFICTASIIFHGKILSNWKKKLIIIFSVVVGFVASSYLPQKRVGDPMEHVLYIGMSKELTDKLYFSADNYTKGIGYADDYGFFLGRAKAYRDRGELNIRSDSKEYAQECRNEICSLLNLFPYDFLRSTLSSSIQSLNIGHDHVQSWYTGVQTAPGFCSFQKKAISYYEKFSPWFNFALLAVALILFLGGGFYKNMFLCMAFMVMSGVYVFQFSIRHNFYLIIISSLIAGFVLTRMMRLSVLCLIDGKRVLEIFLRKRRIFISHLSFFAALVVLAFSILFVAQIIQIERVKHQINDFISAKSEKIDFKQNIVNSKVQKGISATEVLFPELYNNTLARENKKQVYFTEFLKIRMNVVDMGIHEKITVFAKYKGMSDRLQTNCLWTVIGPTKTCPIPLTFCAEDSVNTLYLPVYFARNYSPLLGVEIFAGGKQVSVKSVERITESKLIQTQSAFLIPSQASKMHYVGNIDWKKVFCGRKP